MFWVLCPRPYTWLDIVSIDAYLCVLCTEVVAISSAIFGVAVLNSFLHDIPFITFLTFSDFPLGHSPLF